MGPHKVQWKKGFQALPLGTYNASFSLVKDGLSGLLGSFLQSGQNHLLKDLKMADLEPEGTLQVIKFNFVI